MSRASGESVSRSSFALSTLAVAQKQRTIWSLTKGYFIELRAIARAIRDYIMRTSSRLATATVLFIGVLIGWLGDFGPAE